MLKVLTEQRAALEQALEGLIALRHLITEHFCPDSEICPSMSYLMRSGPNAEKFLLQG
jgi:hypothetical protein